MRPWAWAAFGSVGAVVAVLVLVSGLVTLAHPTDESTAQRCEVDFRSGCLTARDAVVVSDRAGGRWSWLDGEREITFETSASLPPQQHHGRDSATLPRQPHRARLAPGEPITVLYDGSDVVRVVADHELTTTDDPAYAGPLRAWWGAACLGLGVFAVSFGRRGARGGSWWRGRRPSGIGGRLEVVTGSVFFTAGLGALGVDWFGPASLLRFAPPAAVLVLVAWVVRRSRATRAVAHQPEH